MIIWQPPKAGAGSGTPPGCGVFWVPYRGWSLRSTPGYLLATLRVEGKGSKGIPGRCHFTSAATRSGFGRIIAAETAALRGGELRR